MEKKLLFLFTFLFSVLFSQTGQAQNYFFHLLGVAGGQTFTWTGVAGDNDWNNPLNWSTNSVPGVGDVAYFKGAACTGANCNANITSNISILGVDIDVGYAGTITQNSGFTITLGADGWKQAGGTFAGGDSNVTFNASALTLSGSSTYTATTAQTYFNETQATNVDVISTTAAVTLTFPSNSLQKFYLPGNCGHPLYKLNTANKISFYNVTVSTAGTGCGYAKFGHPSIAVEIRGDFTNATLISTDAMIFQGTFELYGNIVLNAGEVERASNWRWMGAANSTYSTTGSFGVGALQIEKTGGATVTPLAGTTQLEVGGLYVKTGSFTFPTALAIYKTTNTTETFKVDTGTTVVVPANSTLSVYVNGACGGPVYTMDVDGNFDLQNVVITGGGSGCGRGNLTVAAGDTITVKKNLTLGSDQDTNGSWILEGNLVKGASAVLGAIALTLQGTAAQTLDTVAWGTGPITVNKASGTASLSANFTVSAAAPAMTVQSGTLNLNAKNLTVTNTLTVGVSGKILCSGGTLTAGSYDVAGEISCGTGVGITWTGAAGDNLWSTAGNWTNNNIPGASDTAIFTSSCTGANCNAQINSNLSVKGVWLTSTYPGTLTQNTTRTLTVGASGWTQTGGTFAGGDATITMNGTFSLTGGTFTSTTNILYAMWTVTMSGGTTVFNHNSGTFNLAVRSNTTLYAVMTGFQFYDFNIYSTNGYLGHRYITGSVDVTRNFSCNITNNGGQIHDGDIFVKGDISFVNLGCGGDTFIHAVGTGNQTISGVSGSLAPAFNINSTGGTVSLVGNLMFQGHFSYTLGTVAAGTSTVEILTDNNHDYNITLASPLSLNNFSIRGYGYFASRTFVGSALTVLGNFICNTSYVMPVFAGTIYVRGDISFVGEGCTGSTLVQAAGTGNQTISGVSTADTAALEINSTGGVVSLSGDIQITSHFTYTQGTVAPGTSTVSFLFSGSSAKSITLAAPLELANITFTGGASGTRTITGGPLTATATVAFAPTSGTGTLNGGTIIAKGDVTASGGGVTGTVLLEIGGSSNQALSGVTNARWPITKFNSTGGTLSLSGVIEFSSDFTYTQGTVDPGTSTVAFLHKGGSTLNLTLDLPLTLNNVSFYGSNSGGSTRTISGNDLTVNAALSCDAGNAAANINGRTLFVKGDVIYGAIGCTGTTALNLTGTTTSTFTVSSFSSGRILGSPITVDKTGGAQVTMATDAYLAAGQNLVLTNGILDLNGNAISVSATLTVGAGTTFKCNGGALTLGTLVNNGSVLCPGYSNYPFQWTGAGGNSNWTNGANWQGGVAPGANDTPSFSDSFCTPNCNVTINTSVSFRGLEIIAPYSGTITQASGAVLTIGNRGWKQPAGTFVGSNANITMTGATGKFSVTGTASFTAPSATLALLGYLTNTNDNIFTVGSSATFNPNGGTVRVSAGVITGSNMSHYFDVPTNFQFNNLVVGQGNGSASYWVNFQPIPGRTIIVNGNLTHGNGDFPAATGYTRLGGTWQVKGNYTVGTDGKGGTGIMTFNGTGTQTVTQATGSTPAGGVWTVNKASGSVVLASALALSTASQDLTITAGTFNMAGFNLSVARNISNSGVLRRGSSPSCGTLTYTGYSGTAAICP